VIFGVIVEVSDGISRKVESIASHIPVGWKLVFPEKSKCDWHTFKKYRPTIYYRDKYGGWYIDIIDKILWKTIYKVSCSVQQYFYKHGSSHP
jgi:hypothetical protein